MKPEFEKLAQELNKEMISRRKETPSINVFVIASALRKFYVMGLRKSSEIALKEKFDRIYDCHGTLQIGCGECRTTHNGCKEIADAIISEASRVEKEGV